MYLVAIMDWASIEEAMYLYGKPDIFNTDQGSQFTSIEFTDILKSHDIKISMDGKGCWMDNVFIERLWRSLKYECIYLQEFDNAYQLREAIANWLEFYNNNRPHSTFAELTPEEVYYRDNSDGLMPKNNMFAA